MNIASIPRITLLYSIIICTSSCIMTGFDIYILYKKANIDVTVLTNIESDSALRSI